MSHEPQTGEGRDAYPVTAGRDLGGVEVAEGRFVPLIDDLHQAISALEDRLTPVVKGDRESPGAMLDSVVPPKRSPLAENLSARADAIQTAIVRLRQLEERIDL